MRRIRSLGAALLALLVLGALGAQAVMAEEGFLPLKTKTFTLHGTTTTSFSTSSASLPPNECALVEGSGTFENDKHGKITLDFFGCSTASFLMRSLSDTTEDEKGGLALWVNALFLICLLSATTYGIFIETNGEVHLEIPALGELIAVKGALIGKIEEAELSSKTTFKVKFEGKKGVQSPTECKGEGKEEVKKHSLTAEVNHNGKPETASVNSEFTITFLEVQLLMMT